MGSSISSVSAAQVAKIIATKTTNTACTGVGVANANTILTATFTSVHNATAMYRIRLYGSVATLGGSASLACKLTSGANVTTISMLVNDNAANGTICAEIVLHPDGTTDVINSGHVWRPGNVPVAASYLGSTNALAGGSTWASQTQLEILGFVSVSGTLNIRSIFIDVISS